MALCERRLTQADPLCGRRRSLRLWAVRALSPRCDHPLSSILYPLSSFPLAAKEIPQELPLHRLRRERMRPLVRMRVEAVDGQPLGNVRQQDRLEIKARDAGASAELGDPLVPRVERVVGTEVVQKRKDRDPQV